MSFYAAVRQVVKWLRGLHGLVPVGLIVNALKSIWPLPATDEEVEKWLDRVWDGVKPLLSFYIQRFVTDIPASSSECEDIHRDIDEFVNEEYAE